MVLTQTTKDSIIICGWNARKYGEQKSPKNDKHMSDYYARCKIIGDSATVSSLWIKGYMMHEECERIGVI